MRRSFVELIVDVRAEAGHAVLAVTGEIDIHTAHALADRLADVVASGERTLIVDLGGVEFLDSSGLGVLVGGLNKERDVGGSLSLVCAHANLLKLFAITGLDRVFVIHPTLAAAIAHAP
jgi:anti-sigma B factor antagonist